MIVGIILGFLGGNIEKNLCLVMLYLVAIRLNNDCAVLSIVDSKINALPIILFISQLVIIELQKMMLDQRVNNISNQMHHKGQKSQKEAKHYSHMMANLEKAMESQESLDKFVIQDKHSQDPSVKQHFKAHNRIIHQIKKQKEQIKKKITIELLQLFKYGFDRTPLNVWKNVMEQKVKKFHPHHLEKQINDFIMNIKQSNEFYCMLKNTFKNIKESELAVTILKMEQKSSFYQKFIDDLTPFPIRNFDKSKCNDSLIGVNNKKNVLEVRSVYESIMSQFQKLKPYSFPNLPHTFSDGVRSKLIAPIDSLINTVAIKTKEQGENTKKIAEIKKVIQYFADYKWDRVSDAMVIDHHVTEDVKKIKKQMQASSKKGYQVYKKVNNVTTQFVKKNNENKPHDKVSVYILQIDRQLQPIMSFCNKIAFLPIIKEYQALQQYKSMKSNYSYFDIIIQILRDTHDKTRQSQMFRSLQMLTKFASSIYSLIINKKQNTYQNVPLDKILREYQNLYSQIKYFLPFKEKYEEAEQQIKNKENLIRQLKSKHQRLEKDYKQFRVNQESETRWHKATIQTLQFQITMGSKKYEQLSRICQEYKGQNGIKDRIMLERCNQIETMKFNFSKEVQQLKQLNKSQQLDVIGMIVFIDKVKEFVKEQLKDTTDYNVLTQYQQIQNQLLLKQKAQRIIKEHQQMHLFIKDIYPKFAKRILRIPYYQHETNDLNSSDLKVILLQINQILKFVFDIFDCFTGSMNKARLWNGDRDLAKMVSKDQKEFEQKIKEMWRNDLKMSATFYINRHAIHNQQGEQMQND